jgi:hypothetical protein
MTRNSSLECTSSVTVTIVLLWVHFKLTPPGRALTNVAICDATGVATAGNPGFTNIRADWEAPVWWLDDAQPDEVCVYDPFNAVVEAFCDVFGLDVHSSPKQQQ